MGLATTHDCWHGSYDGFAKFRERLCDAAGLPTTPSRLGGRYLDADWENVTEDQVMGHWGDTVPQITETIYGPYITDPLLYLLIHSDCEGVLENRYLPQLRDRLVELLPKMDEGDWYDNPRGQTQAFIDGLSRAIDAGDDVEFG